MRNHYRRLWERATSLIEPQCLNLHPSLAPQSFIFTCVCSCAAIVSDPGGGRSGKPQGVANFICTHAGDATDRRFGEPDRQDAAIPCRVRTRDLWLIRPSGVGTVSGENPSTPRPLVALPSAPRFNRLISSSWRGGVSELTPGGFRRLPVPFGAFR